MAPVEVGVGAEGEVGEGVEVDVVGVGEGVGTREGVRVGSGAGDVMGLVAVVRGDVGVGVVVRAEVGIEVGLVEPEAQAGKNTAMLSARATVILSNSLFFMRPPD